MNYSTTDCRVEVSKLVVLFNHSRETINNRIMITPEAVVQAIYVVEGGTHTKFPYGIKSIHTTNPRQVCLNTVNHALRDYSLHHVDRAFIYFLSERYCPSSCDPVGHKNWEVNMVRILHL